MSQPTWWRGGRGLPSLIALFTIVFLLLCSHKANIIHIYIKIFHLIFSVVWFGLVWLYDDLSPRRLSAFTRLGDSCHSSSRSLPEMCRGSTTLGEQLSFNYTPLIFSTHIFSTISPILHPIYLYHMIHSFYNLLHYITSSNLSRCITSFTV